MRPQLVVEEVLFGSRVARISVKRAPFLELFVEIPESWQVFVCLSVVRLRESGQAAEELRHRRRNRNHEDPARRIPLERKRTDHYREQAAETAQHTHRQRERSRQLLFPLQLEIVALLEEVEVERLHRVRLYSGHCRVSGRRTAQAGWS